MKAPQSRRLYFKYEVPLVELTYAGRCCVMFCHDEISQSAALQIAFFIPYLPLMLDTK